MTIDINEFIKKLESEFEDVEPGTLLPITSFKDLDKWDSMHALILIAFMDVEYGVIISGDDLVNVGTVEDVFNIVIKSKE